MVRFLPSFVKVDSGRIFFRLGFLGTFLLLAVLSGSSSAEEFEIERRGEALDVKIDGQLFTTYLHKDFAKPILYPILGPHGIPLTRNWPMKKDVPGEAADHPHHQSFWFTHGNVNGIDFWTQSSKTGRIVQTKRVRAEGGKERAVIETENEWRDAQGKGILTDTRELIFSVIPAGRVIDFRIDLHASHGPVTFGDTKEGTLAIRARTEFQSKTLPSQKKVTVEGHAVNSEGIRDTEVWGKRANWIDYWAKVEGHTLGIAVFDHPENLRHPTWWHARDYGLIAANPFGIHDFEKGKPAKSGDFTISEGKSLTLRYRFVFHEGDPEQAKIAQCYQYYVRGEGKNQPDTNQANP